MMQYRKQNGIPAGERVNVVSGPKAAQAAFVMLFGGQPGKKKKRPSRWTGVKGPRRAR
jgi:hypothetical protein